MSLTATDREILAQWHWEHNKPASFVMLEARDERMPRFRIFAEEFKALASQIQVTVDQGADGDPPSFHLGTAFRYVMIPSGGELKPFLELLSSLMSGGGAQDDLSEATRNRLNEIPFPADIKLYVTPQCPHCPTVLRRVQGLVLANPLLHLTVIDGSLFPEMAVQDAVRSVPTLILDGHFRWTGLPDMEEFMETLITRNPSQLSPRALKDFLKEGNAGRLAAMMVLQNVVFPAFPDLIVHPEWSVRLGALVTMEEVAEQNLELARQVLPELLKKLDGLDTTIKGDVVYLLGLLGTDASIPTLKALLNGERNSSLREVIVEALENLQSRDEIGGA